MMSSTNFLMSASQRSGNTLLGTGIFRNIPRSPAPHTQKNAANASTTNPTSKLPKFMPSKSHVPFPTTSRNVALATKSSKPYQSAAKVIAGKNASVRLPIVKMNLACSSSSSNASAANHGKSIVENHSGPSKAIPNCSPSTRLHENIFCAPSKVAPSLPQSINYVPGCPPAPVHAKPSALRMPLPSFGFFCQEILEKKTGPVQHSPPDKAAPDPGPWSPVKNKAQDIGPYDCTEYTKNVATSNAQYNAQTSATETLQPL